MSTFYEVIQKKFGYIKNFRSYIIAAIAVAIFVILARYGYETYYKPFYSKNVSDNGEAGVSDNGEAGVSDNGEAGVSDNGEAVITFYHVDWCPHCKTAQPEWENFRRQYNNKRINNYTLKCKDVECKNEEICPNMVSFPTVKLTKNGKDIEFDSKINVDSLTYFVETVLQE